MTSSVLFEPFPGHCVSLVFYSLKLGLKLFLSACLDSSICLCSVNKTYDFSVISLIE